MNALLRHVAIVVLATGTMLVDTARPEAQDRPRFGAQAVGVRVSVSVKNGNRPVVGLTGPDFQLLDSGVVQTIAEVGYEDVPIDVTLVIDVSGSAEATRRQHQDDALRIADLLRDIDSLRVLVFDRAVYEVVARQPARDVRTSGGAASGAMSAVSDALAVALMEPGDPTRRRLVVAMTDGYENASVLDASSVQQLAARCDAVLYLVLNDPVKRSSASLSDVFARPSGPFYAASRFDRELEMFRRVAESTGGQVKNASPWGSNPVSVFKAAFDEFRTSYVLTYMPTDVSATGWHELDVKVPAYPKYSVRFRSGYFGG